MRINLHAVQPRREGRRRAVANPLAPLLQALVETRTTVLLLGRQRTAA